MVPAARITSLSAAMSFMLPSVINLTPTQRVPLKFSFTTLVLSSSLRFGLDNAGRRKARTALTRVPSAAMFMFIYAGMAATSPLSSVYDYTLLKMRRPACFYALAGFIEFFMRSSGTRIVSRFRPFLV